MDLLMPVFMVGRGGVEPPFSVFQTGAPTVYATVPYYLNIEHHSTIVHIHSRSLFSNFCVYISLFQIFLLQGTNLFCKMLDLNQLPIVYQTIALPYELISLQKLIAVRAFIYNKQKRKENHYDSWLRGVGLEPTIFSL